MSKPKKTGKKLNWKQACAVLGCKKTKFYNLVNSGKLYAEKSGDRGLIVYEDDAKACVKPVEQ